MKRFAIIFVLGLAAPSATHAADPSPGWQPGLGDLMTMSVQPRHSKLGIAGQQGNWAYAAYELNELQEALGDVSQAVPAWDGFPVAEKIALLTKAPIAALDAAVKAKDEGAFKRQYEKLTETCNLCHMISGHAAIVIQVPAASAFPDQDFRPSRK